MEVKYRNCVFLTLLLYRISVLKSIAIIVACVTICSFYECIVDYPCGCANIHSTMLVLSMDVILLRSFALM